MQAEALLQQVTRRMFEAMQQLTRLDAQPVRNGVGQTTGKRSGGDHRLAQALRGAEPWRGETGMSGASEVAGSEGLQRVLMSNSRAGATTGSNAR